MKSSLRYAKALLDLSIEQKTEDELYNDMLLVGSTIRENDELDSFLKSAIIKATDKKEALNKIFESKVGNITKGLFSLLVDNKRMSSLETITQQYLKVYNSHNNIQTAVVTTAVAIDDATKDKVLAKLKELTGASTTVTNVVDPEIIGGFVLRVGDKQYDASIKNNINNLRKEFGNSQY
ncbi:MAG: ATP synthase F1 subunit delta [Flavobacteriaceae bacterium]|nr:ATP synthase F1 subunit delta [Flavobacteriaceae bacterium]